MERWKAKGWMAVAALLLVGLALGGCSGSSDDDPVFMEDFTLLTADLGDSYLHQYDGVNDGGVAHATYWTLAAGDPAYDALSPEEQAKVGLIQANVLHSVLFQPDQRVAGHEATGLLDVDGRVQNVVLKVPENWNGDMDFDWFLLGESEFRRKRAKV